MGALGARAFAPSTGPRALGARARSIVQTTTYALEWDDNAFWLEACEELGVVSWYDAGLRLTAASTVSEADGPAEKTERIAALHAAGEVTIAQRAEKLAGYEGVVRGGLASALGVKENAGLIVVRFEDAGDLLQVARRLLVVAHRPGRR